MVSTLSDLNRALRPLINRVRLTVSRGIIKRTNSSVGLQTAQIKLLKGELRDDVEMIEQYGLTSNPPDGSESVVVSLGGDRSHCVVIGFNNRRFRLKGLAKGEVALWTDEGDKLVFKRGHTIEATTTTFIVNAMEKVRFNTPLIEVNGEVRATGDIIDHANDTARSMAAMRNIYNNHHHNETNSVTNTPNEVM